MNSQLVTIYVAANLPQAFLLKNLLADYGIEARVLDEAIHGSAEDPTETTEEPVPALKVLRADLEL